MKPCMYISSLFLQFLFCSEIYAALSVTLSNGTPAQIGTQSNFDTSNLQATANYSGEDGGSMQVGIGYTALCESSNPIPGGKLMGSIDIRRITFGFYQDSTYANVRDSHHPSGWQNIWEAGSIYPCDLQVKGVAGYSTRGGGGGINILGSGFNISVNGATDQAEEIKTMHFTMLKPRRGIAGCGISPIILDLKDNGFDLTGLDNPVLFDIDFDGALEKTSWTASGKKGDGFLVNDLNNNGTVDGGSELFGDSTILMDGSFANHGYEALAELDLVQLGGNEDGVINYLDKAYWELSLWVDSNHDGVSDKKELFSLWEKGVISINTEFWESEEQDEYGNLFAYLSTASLCRDKYCRKKKVIQTTDVFFIVEELPVANLSRDGIGIVPSSVTTALTRRCTDLF